MWLMISPSLLAGVPKTCSGMQQVILVQRDLSDYCSMQFPIALWEGKTEHVHGTLHRKNSAFGTYTVFVWLSAAIVSWLLWKQIFSQFVIFSRELCNTCKIKINIRRQKNFSLRVAAQSKKCSCQAQRDSVQLSSCSTGHPGVHFTTKILQAQAEPQLPYGISFHMLQIRLWHEGLWRDLFCFSLPCTKHVRSQWIYQNSIQPKRKAFPWHFHVCFGTP